MSLDNIIQTWYRLARGEDVERSDIFFQFVAIWVAFNALYSSTAYDDAGDFNQVRTFAGIAEVIDRHRKLLDENAQYSSAIQVLQSHGVRDLSSGIVRRIDNPRNLTRVASCVYQVRCNLFHGGKAPGNTRDEKLVKASYIIVTKLIEPFLNEAFIIRNAR
jgi:hypothetical protein